MSGRSITADSGKREIEPTKAKAITLGKTKVLLICLPIIGSGLGQHMDALHMRMNQEVEDIKMIRTISVQSRDM